MKTKKLLAMLTVLAMCMGLISVPAMAEGDNVAQIGETQYATLAAAIEAVQNGGTITLTADASGDGISVPSGKNFILDFANHTYTVDGDLAGSTGTKTQAFQLLKDSTITFKNGRITSSKAKMLIQNYCNLTLDNMTLDGTSLEGDAPYTLSNNNGNVVINNTTINAKSGGFAFDVYSFSIYTGANVTVNSGTFDGKIEVDAKSGADTTDLGLTINGGTFEKEIVTESYGDKITITGGTFKTDVSDYVADGYVLGTDGTVTAKMVAKIGNTEYATLADAVAEVPTDGTKTTITMIADHQIVGNAGVKILATKNIVLDLNGHTLSNYVNENKASQVIENNGTLTIKDSATGGTVTNAYQEGTNVGEWWSTPQYNYATNVIKNSGTLTVESGNITQTAAGSICYAIDNNSTSRDTTLTINGGAISDSYGTVIRAFCNSTTKENNININGGTVTTPGYAALWIQLPGNKGEAKKFKLNITGGTLTGGTYAFYDYSYGDVFDVVNYNITGGNFGGYVAAGYIKDVGFTDKDGIIKFIKGGKYTQKPDDAYIATGYVAKAIDDPVYKYEVVKATAQNLENLVIDEDSNKDATTVAIEEVGADLTATENTATVVTAQQKTAGKEFNIVTVTKTGDENPTATAQTIAVTPKATTIDEVTNTIAVDNIDLETLGVLFAQKVDDFDNTTPTAELSLSITQESTTDTSVTYDVHPEVTIGDKTYPLEGPVVDGEYTFKLPVSNSFVTATRKTVKVTYENEDPVYLPVQGTENNYYVDVTVTHFSDATVEPAEDVVISDVDAYVVRNTEAENYGLGNIRFITRVNSNSEIESYGTYFLLANDITNIKQSQANVVGNRTGTKTTFGTDIKNIDPGNLDTTIYAMSFIKVSGSDEYVWSDVKGASVNEYNHNK